MEEKELRLYSRIVVDGVEQAPSRAMLRAVGSEEEDFRKPQVGIASTWSMITPCNMHIHELAQKAGEGADSAGGKSVVFNTITVSDGIAMGTIAVIERVGTVARPLDGRDAHDGILAIFQFHLLCSNPRTDLTYPV